MKGALIQCLRVAYTADNELDRLRQSERLSWPFQGFHPEESTHPGPELTVAPRGQDGIEKPV
jgi:hypothetical protein